VRALHERRAGAGADTDRALEVRGPAGVAEQCVAVVLEAGAVGDERDLLARDVALSHDRLYDADRRRHRLEVEGGVDLARQDFVGLVRKWPRRLDFADRARRIDEAPHPVERQVVVAAVGYAAPRVLDDEVGG
jgi:IS5 family transposase